MESRPLVRPVRPGDMPAWRAMRARLWPQSGASASDEVAAYFDDGLIDGVPHAVFVAEVQSDADAIVGFIEMSTHDAVTWHPGGRVVFIEGWYVHPDYRCLGVGRALLRTAEDAARSMGATAMGSDTDAEHAALSVPAHERCGFTRVKFAVTSAEDAIGFVKVLDPRGGTA